MTTEQLIERLRKSGLEEVCARTSRSIVFKINDDKFIEVQDTSARTRIDKLMADLLGNVVFWHSIESSVKINRSILSRIPAIVDRNRASLGTSFWGRLRIWNVCRSNEFEEHFTRFLNE